MRAGANRRSGEGKTLAERLAETRAASTRQAVQDEDLTTEEIEATEDDASVPDGYDQAGDTRPVEETEPVAKAKPAVQRRPVANEQPPARRQPAEDTDAIVQAAKAARASSHQEAPKVCLVVDDSRVIRKLTSKVARSLGYHVLEAENGEEALARCRQAMPDLILTDWSMPVMSGLEFVTALRAMPVSTAPTVMFCTSKGEAEDIHAGINAGADDYIVKPFAEEALKAKLVKLGVA